MVIYIDSAFLLNAALDWLLLYFTGYLAGLEQRWGRLLLAACGGGCYAVATLFFPESILSFELLKAAVGVFLLWGAYGTSAHFWRLIIPFYALSFGLAGAVLAAELFFDTSFLYGGAYILPIKGNRLIPVTVGIFLLLFFRGRGSERHQICREIVPVQFDLLGKTVKIRALRDSGNTLKEELSGAPVLVVEASALAHIWPESLCEFADPEQLKNPEGMIEMAAGIEERPLLRLFSYRSVGTEKGMLLACRVYQVQIGRYRRNSLWVALSPTPVSESREYEALWGGPMDDKRAV